MRSLPTKSIGLAALALLLALSLVALACQGDSEPTAFSCAEGVPAGQPQTVDFPVTVTDSKGSRVTLDAPPQSIASLSAGHTEIFFAIGAGDQVGTVDRFSDCPQQAASLPQVDSFQPNIEAIADLEPDLVLIFFDPGDLQASLERLGIPVLFLASPESVAGVLEQVRLLGQVTGHSEEAEEVAADMEERVESVTEKLADVQQGPRIFHELDPTLFTTCPGEFIDDLYQTLKAQNIATQPALPCQLSQEAVIAADPEVIVLADEAAGVTVDSVKARSGWGNITAVKVGRVHLVDPDIFSRPGPRIVDALEVLAKLLHPELFQ